MTITPDQARELLNAAKEGHTADIRVSAPDMAETIAGMTWEYAVEHEHAPGKWHRVTEWGPEANPYQHGYGPGNDERIIRCLVGPVEVIDGE